MERKVCPEFGGDIFQWLRGFYYTVVNRSLSKAASEMGRSQSTLSHQIKSLENEFGVVLFDRSKRRMKLTFEGEILFENALSIFDAFGNLKEMLESHDMPLKGAISIVATQAVLRDILPGFISSFHGDHPQINFFLDVCNSTSEIQEKIAYGMADFGISINEHLSNKMDFTPFFKSSLAFISPINGPYHVPSIPELDQITRIPFLSLFNSSAVMRYVNAFLTLHNRSLNVIQVLNSAELIKKYVEIGFGVSILGSYSVLEEDNKRLAIHQLDKYFPKITYGIIRRKNAHLSLETKTFFQLLLKDDPSDGAV